jgi:hypothetical protein
MGRSESTANLSHLCRALENYASADGAEPVNKPCEVADRLSGALYLAHSTSDANFSDICRCGHLSSAERLAAERSTPLKPSCAELVLGTAGCVFFYISPFRFPSTGCGLLFAKSLEARHSEHGAASPFDSGGLIRAFNRTDVAEPPRHFLSRHELPIPEHRGYLGRSMSFLFLKPEHYVEGVDPYRPGPIGLTGGDQRRWTHEVRIPGRVFVRGSDLQAVFAPRSRVAADPEIGDLFQWCMREGVDRILLDTPRRDDFEALRRECVAYVRRKLY